MNLFERKDFIMYAGGEADYKIECDALTRKDWETVAYIISKRVDFKLVRGVPSVNGIKLQKALFKYRNPESNTLLIVDDVFTTGKSMNEFRHVLEGTYPQYSYKGVVLFARNECPQWIQPIFQMW